MTEGHSDPRFHPALGQERATHSVCLQLKFTSLESKPRCNRGWDIDGGSPRQLLGEEERHCPSLPGAFAKVSSEVLSWQAPLPLLRADRGCLHCVLASLRSDLACQMTPPYPPPSLSVVSSRFLSQAFVEHRFCLYNTSSGVSLRKGRKMTYHTGPTIAAR